MKIQFSDFINNQAHVLNYLDREFFTDSTVTMSNDEYLKKTIRDRLLQVVFFTEGVISLDKNADTLNKAMLRSSLRDKDIETILNTSLKISDLHLSVQSTEELANGDAEKIEEYINKQKEGLATIEGAIGIIEDNLGDTRVKYRKFSEEEIKEGINAGFDIEYLSQQSVEVTKPLLLNLDFLDLKKFEPADIYNLISQSLSVNSNAELTYELSSKLFIDPVVDFFANLEAFLDVAITHARQASINNTTFIAEADPFLQLWNAL